MDIKPEEVPNSVDIDIDSFCSWANHLDVEITKQKRVKKYITYVVAEIRPWDQTIGIRVNFTTGTFEVDHNGRKLSVPLSDVRFEDGLIVDSGIWEFELRV